MEFVSVFKIKSSSERTLSIDLLGGIGNQLFRYYAATTIAEHLNLKVRFFLGALPENHPQFNSRILDLGFPINPEPRVYSQKYSLLLRKVSSYLSARSVILKKVEKIFLGIHTESGLGILEECNSILKKFNSFPFPGNIHLDGHFQDIMYFTNRSSTSSEIILATKTNPISLNLKFQKLDQDLENICVVHIRRGDFKTHINDIGLLSKSYYESAMTNFILSCKTPHFLIISDEMTEAEAMIADKHRSICHFIQESEQMNPAALLHLMSMYKNFILSNSTFSLWIALLAQETKYVAYPVPFNRSLNLQVRGFPHTWKPEVAYFET